MAPISSGITAGLRPRWRARRYRRSVANPDLPDDELAAHWEFICKAVEHTQDRVYEQVESVGVPRQWFVVLHLLLRSPERRMPMSQLARELSMTSGGFTKLADRMGQEGVIDRRNSVGDRRVVYAALTTEGLRIARRAERVYRAALREHVLDVLSPAHLAGLADSVQPLDRAHAAALEEVPQALPKRPPGMPERRRRAVSRTGT